MKVHSWRNRVLKVRLRKSLLMFLICLGVVGISLTSMLGIWPERFSNGLGHSPQLWLGMTVVFFAVTVVATIVLVEVSHDPPSRTNVRRSLPQETS
jgi:uncharacterized membrane protein YqjE